MLTASLLPLLTRYSLTLDLVAGPDEAVTLTIIPRRPEGASHKIETGEIRPISITATAQEIDAELARGSEGALGWLIGSRKTLGDQLAEQRRAAEEDKAAAAAAAKAKAATASTKPSTSAPPAKAQSPAAPPADAMPGEPASLW